MKVLSEAIPLNGGAWLPMVSNARDLLLPGTSGLGDGTSARGPATCGRAHAQRGSALLKPPKAASGAQLAVDTMWTPRQKRRRPLRGDPLVTL
jgi:hypothetical protein